MKWTQPNVTNDGAALEAAVSNEIWKSVNTEVSMLCRALYECGLHNELLAMEIDPSAYDDVQAFADDYQSIALLKKSLFLETGIDTDHVALKKAAEAEASCFLTNKRLGALTELPSDLKWILLRAIHNIEQALGSIEQIHDELPRFGPGVSSSVRRQHCNIAGKISGRAECTEAAAPHVERVLLDHPWLELSNAKIAMGHSIEREKLVIVSCNKATFVPKTAKTSRLICIEPHLNMVLQLQAGASIRRALKHFKIDLDNQAVRNKQLARRGSIDGSLATIDLSSASDMISMEVVKLLIPDDWFKYLSDLRSPQTLYPGNELVMNHKFSAMGNGYTFELESLLFAAIAEASTAYCYADISQVSVFGDDIILPTAGVPRLYACFDFLGFKVNEEKSFTEGPFRESCGGDFFKGHDVRPFFLKKERYDVQATIGVVNSIRRYAMRLGDGIYCDVRFQAAWQNTVCSFINADSRFYGPSCFGDSLIWGNPGEELLDHDYQRSSLGGYVLVGFQQRRVNRYCGYAELAASLSKLERVERDLRLVLPGPKSKRLAYFSEMKPQWIKALEFEPVGLPTKAIQDEYTQLLCRISSLSDVPYDATPWL